MKRFQCTTVEHSKLQQTATAPICWCFGRYAYDVIDRDKPWYRIHSVSMAPLASRIPCNP